jgi:hypothetical protein
MMTHIESVAQLRKMIENKTLAINNCPGVYRWWFREDVAQRLLSNLPQVDTKRISKRILDDGNHCYWTLYFGISKNLKQRIVWHITQQHTRKSVESGFLSTLRQTISALLNQDMTKCKCQDDVNSIMDACYLEWEYVGTEEDADDIETKELSQSLYIYPLNVAKNKTVSKEHLKCLTKLRRDFRK